MSIIAYVVRQYEPIFHPSTDAYIGQRSYIAANFFTYEEVSDYIEKLHADYGHDWDAPQFAIRYRKNLSKQEHRLPAPNSEYYGPADDDFPF